MKKYYSFDSLGKFLRLFRHQQRLTQKEFAAKLNISASKLGRIERGEESMEVDELATFMQVFSLKGEIKIGDFSLTPEGGNFNLIDC